MRVAPNYQGEQRDIRLVKQMFYGEPSEAHSRKIVSVLSFGLELCQLVLPRSPSMADVLLNTLGGINGAIAGVFYYGGLTRIVQKCWWKIQSGRWLASIFIGYILTVGVVFSVPVFRTDFSNWDNGFTFQLGNEGTLDRPWLGKLYLVAIYDRALRPDEVLTNFTAGPDHHGARERTQGGLVMLYPFLEGSGSTVHDHAPSGPPFDLVIRDPGRVNWLSPNGLEFLGGTIITRPEPTEKLFHRATRNARSLTVEAWIAPASLHQTGPARIVSYSLDPGLRNFTLGQAKQDIVFRLRTPVTGENGTRPQLETVDGPLTGGMQHVVITYLKNLATLYLNGEEHAEILLDGSSSWELPSIFDIVAGLKMKWFCWPVILFPLGLISYTLYARSRYQTGMAVFLSLLTGLAFLGVTEALQIVMLRRDANFFLLQVGTVVVLMSIVTGAVLRTSMNSYRPMRSRSRSN